MKRLKLFTATEGRLLRISIVSKPANLGRFAIKEETEDSLLVAAPIIIANQLIYRNNEENGECNVVFTPSVVKDIMEEAVSDKSIYKFDIEHNEEDIEGVTLVQNFLIDSNSGIRGFKGLYGLNEGSWVGLFRITNKDVLEAVKSGKMKGVSVSLMASYEEVVLKDAVEMYNTLNRI